MTTGFGNEQAQDAVRRTLKGGSSGRITVFVIVAAFLALGVLTGNLFILIPSAIATALSVLGFVQAARSCREAGRIGPSRKRR